MRSSASAAAALTAASRLDETCRRGIVPASEASLVPHVRCQAGSTASRWLRGARRSRFRRGRPSPGPCRSPSGRAASVSTALRSRRSATVGSSSDRSMSWIAPSRTAGVGTREPETRERGSERSPEPVVAADLRQGVRGRLAGVGARERIDERVGGEIAFGRLDDENLVVGGAAVQPIFEERGQQRRVRADGPRRSSAPQWLPCRRMTLRGARRATRETSRPRVCAASRTSATGDASTTASSSHRSHCPPDRVDHL